MAHSLTQDPLSKIRVLICDDHPTVILGVTEYLSLKKHIEIVGTATRGEEAIRMAKELRPDVLLIDIGLPDISGIEVTHRLLRDMPEARIVILTMYQDEEYAIQFHQSGALGYVLKSNDPEEFVQAIEFAMRGEIYASPSIASIIFKLRRNNEESDKCKLTTTERAVLISIANGLTSKQIAKKLNTAVPTANKHRENIKNKLNLHSIAELTAYAIKHKLL